MTPDEFRAFIAESITTDKDVRDIWAEQMKPEEFHEPRQIRLLDGTGFVAINVGGAEPTASIVANGVILTGIDLKQCGALIEALCEAEWHLIGPVRSA